MSGQKIKQELSVEDKAKNTGLNIFKSGYNKGKAEGRNESTDPDAKRLGYLVQGAVKMKGKGKNSTTKQLRNLSNNIADADDYASIEALTRKSLLMLANCTKPVKEKSESKQTSESPPTPPTENEPN